jgi:UDP-N-acetyl-D-glucosamine dehydrogenase
MTLQLLDAPEQPTLTGQLSAKEALIAKIDSKQARVAIVGMGYVGLPLAKRFVECGFPVLGLDSCATKTATLNAGSSYIHHIPDLSIRSMRDKGFFASTDPKILRSADCIVICVPTPLDAQQQPDLTCINTAMTALTPQLRSGQFVCLQSTTYPGTTRDLADKYLANSLLEIGVDVFIGYSPEREDPGSSNIDSRTVPKVCSGLTQNCLEVCVRLLLHVVNRVVPVSSTGAAEMAKLLENSYRAVNIALVNEFKKIADVLGLDMLEVIEAAATKPYGFVPHYPGPGVGGHCIPVDPVYLVWKAKQAGLTSTLIEAAVAVNESMPEWVLGKVLTALPASEPQGNRRVLVLGITYKKNVDDTRCSPALRLIELMLQEQIAVDYSDPYASLPVDNLLFTTAGKVQLNAEVLKEYNAVIVTVDHDAFDYGLVSRHARLIIDTRGVYRGSLAAVHKVVSA